MATAGIINSIVRGSSKLIKEKTSGLCQGFNKASGASQLESELAGMVDGLSQCSAAAVPAVSSAVNTSLL